MKTNRYDAGRDTLQLSDGPGRGLDDDSGLLGDDLRATATRATASCPAPCPPPRSASRSAASSSGPPGWPRPTAPARTTPTPTTGRPTAASATSPPPRPTSGRSAASCRCSWRSACSSSGSTATELWYGEAKGVPLADKLIDTPLTSSQLKAAKFFLVVILLFLVQTSFGGLLAHYTVHPGHVLPRRRRPRSSRTAGPRAGTCSSPSSGSPPPGWPRRSTWRRSSAGASRRGQGLLVQLLFARDPAGRRRQPGRARWPGSRASSGSRGSGSATRGGSTWSSGRLWQILLFVGLIVLARDRLPGGGRSCLQGEGPERLHAP